MSDTSVYERFHDSRDKIVAAIDCGEWKHSWHLPRGQHGFINWHSDDTVKKCVEILKGERYTGIRLAARAQELLDVLTAEQDRREKLKQADAAGEKS